MKGYIIIAFFFLAVVVSGNPHYKRSDLDHEGSDMSLRNVEEDEEGVSKREEEGIALRNVEEDEEGVSKREVDAEDDDQQSVSKRDNSCGFPSSTFSEEQQTEITNAHNTYRAAEGSDLPDLVWNDELAAACQKLVNECTWKHDYLYDCDNSRMGQNMYVYGGGSSLPSILPSRAVDAWYSEKPQYDFASTTCLQGMCGHYTQVVWQGTHEVGCAYKECPSFPLFKNGNAVMICCNYRPAGNYRGQNPY